MSLARWLERHAAFTPAKAAIRFEDQALSYADLAERTRRLAAGLREELGIRRGDRVAWLGLNHPDCLALLFACARLGAILVPLNWRLAPAELRAILADAEPKALFCQAALRERIDEIRAGFPEMPPDRARTLPTRAGPRATLSCAQAPAPTRSKASPRTPC